MAAILDRPLASYRYFAHHQFPINPHTMQLDDEQDWPLIETIADIVRGEHRDKKQDCRAIGRGCPYTRVGVIPWSKDEENGVLLGLGLDRRTQEYSDFGGAMHMGRDPEQEALREFYEETLGFEAPQMERIEARAGNTLTIFQRVANVYDVQRHYRQMSKYYTAGIEMLRGRDLTEYYEEPLRQRIFDTWETQVSIFPEMADVDVFNLRQFRELLLFQGKNSRSLIRENPPKRNFYAYPGTVWSRVRDARILDWAQVEDLLLAAPNA